MKKKLSRNILSLIAVIAVVITFFLQESVSSAAQLSNVSYSYFNDGDMGENPLQVSIQGKKITIKAGEITKTSGNNSKTCKNFKKVFKITSKLSRYLCVTSDKYTGTVSAIKFKKDLKKVKNHTYGSITFYVKGKKIVGYEIYA